jgi:hypothetical protein
MHSSSLRRLWEAALIVGAPLLLAIVELFHPHPHDLLELNVSAWLWVHYAQIPLFPLSALAIATLVHDRGDLAAILCRGAMSIFAISYTAFDTAAGVVTGILVRPLTSRVCLSHGALPLRRSGRTRSWAARP